MYPKENSFIIIPSSKSRAPEISINVYLTVRRRKLQSFKESKVKLPWWMGFQFQPESK